MRDLKDLTEDDLEDLCVRNVNDAKITAAIDREMDRRLKIEMKKYNDWWDSLTFEQQVTVRHRSYLRNCRDNRRRLRDSVLNRFEFLNDMWRDGLRRSQRGLVKVRAWRSTGVWPGDA